MQSSGKRTIQVNVKLSGDDFALLQKAAQKLWPDAVISNSGLLLGLAKMTAKRLVEEGPKKSGTKRR